MGFSVFQHVITCNDEIKIISISLPLSFLRIYHLGASLFQNLLSHLTGYYELSSSH